MVSPADALTESVTHKFRRARATVTLRRGRTKRGFWVTVTAEDPGVIGTVERAVLATGLAVHPAGRADPDALPPLSTGAPAGGAVPMVAAPVRWSYEWADLLVREEADGAYHVYRRRVGRVSGSDGLQLEELLVTASREHALLEMGALLEVSSRPAHAQWSAGRPGKETPPRHAAARKAA